ncbi:MAG: hypothetical protein AAGB05_17125 [Pseudomonadota bacterium]
MSQFQNVFVLCTGRCGSTTFMKACKHFTNYTASHERKAKGVLGRRRLRYPTHHIEVDNRLSWMLGRLDEAYGQDAFYVHLTRDPAKVAASYAERTHGLMRSYQPGIIMGPRKADPIEIAADMVETVTANIRLFLRDKPHCMAFPLEDAAALFPDFARCIGAEGDIADATAEFETSYNAGNPRQRQETAPKTG